MSDIDATRARHADATEVRAGQSRSECADASPTQAESSATETLCRMLDERGVEYVLDEEYGRKYPPEKMVTWSCDIADEDMTITARDYFIGDGEYCLDLEFHEVFTPEQAVAATLGTKVTGDTSDGYHTFNELYAHRAVLFSVIVHDHQDRAWKSRLHHDGTMYEGMFIVGIETPSGQATYHYDIDPYWDMFDCKELDRAPEWDGHTPDDAIARIATLREGKLTDKERIAYIIGWLHGFEPMIWALVGEKLADETAAEYSRLVYELAALLGIDVRGGDE